MNMLNDISVSVIVPVYNVEKYIEKCLRSLLEQTEKIDEIIIIDDGSTDASYEICKQISSKEERVKLVHQDNSGQGAARNIGIRIAKADYIVFVDSDDMISQDTIKQIKFGLQSNKVDMLCYDADVLMECDYIPLKKTYDRAKILDLQIISGKELFSKLYPLNYTTSVCLAAYRHRFLLENQILFPEGIVHEDDVFSFYVIMLAKRVKYLGKKLYVRRYRENSTMTSEWSYKRWEGNVKGYLEICKFLRNKNKLIHIHDVQNVIYAFLYNNLKRIVQDSYRLKETNNDINREIIINNFFETCEDLRLETDNLCAKLKSTQYLINLLKENKITSTSMFATNLINNSYFIEKEYDRLLMEKFKVLPFSSSDLKVGIYGIGKHTQDFLKQYEKLIGNIKSSYFFVDSYVMEKNAEYCGKPLININSAKGKADTIVVSSFIFQDVINEKIDEVLGRDFVRVNLYNKNDLISYFG